MMLKSSFCHIEIGVHLHGSRIPLKSKPITPDLTDSNDVEIELILGTHSVIVQLSSKPENKKSSQVNLSIENQSDHPIFLDYVKLILSQPVSEKEQQDWLVYLDAGKPAWCGVKHLNSLDLKNEFQLIDDQNIREPGDHLPHFHRSNLHSLLFNTAIAQGFLVGFLSQQQGYNGIDIFPKTSSPDQLSYIIVWQMIGATIQQGYSVELDPILIHINEDPLFLMKDYAQRVKAYHQKSFDEPPFVGMMTWYGYHSAITETIIRNNLPLLHDLFDDYPQPMNKTVLIDHGWSIDANWGYWLKADPERFFTGMGSLSELVNEAGFSLGLWYTPFCVTENAPNYQALLPLLAQKLTNEPFENKVSVFGHLPGHSEKPWPIWFLDAGLEEVQKKWFTELHQMTEGWQCQYWKLDFFALLTSEKYQRKFPVSQLYKTTYQNFRNAVGKQRHLAPCSGDTNIHLGYADSMRITADIGKAGNWPKDLSNYRLGLSTVAALFHKNRTFWINDADSIQIGCGCSLNEARVRATMVAFSGGHLFVSEDLQTISNDRLEIIRRILPACPQAAIPLDLFQNVYPESYPHIWQLENQSNYGTNFVLAIFNLTQETCKQMIHPEWFGIPQGSSFSVIEWWQQHWLGKHDNPFVIEIPPADVAVLHAGLNFDYPWLISCSHHHTGTRIINNLIFDHTTTTLSGEIVTKPGLKLSLMGTIPEGWRIPLLSDAHTRENGEGGWTHDMKTKSHKSFFEIQFQKIN